MSKEEKKTEETSEIKNIVKVSDSGPCKKKISIEVPQEAIKEAIDKDTMELRRDAVLPGFRKGKAPIRLIEKRFGNDLKDQVKMKLIADGSEKALEDNKIDKLSEPNVDFEKIELPTEGPMTFEFEVEVRPDFDLPSLEGIKVEKPIITIQDADIDKEIGELQKAAGLWKPAEGAKADIDDQIIADVTIAIQGQEDSDNKHEGTEISVRETGMVAGIPVKELAKLLKGAKQDDVKKTTVEVPETFYNEDYRGKKVDLEITVQDVKKLEPAELNEDFFKRYGCETVDDLKESLRQYAENSAERKTKTAMADDVRKYLLDNIKFDLPADVVADQSSRLMQRQYMNLMMQGMEKEKVKEMMEIMRTSSQQQAEEQLKSFFIMDKVADTLKVEVDDAQVNGYIAQMAAQKGKRPEKMREEMLKDGSLAQFSLQVREDKCIEKILETADIKEVDAAKKKAATKKKAPAKKKDDSDKKAEPKKKAATKKKESDK